MNVILPRLTDRAHYEALHGREDVWSPAARVIAQRHGLESRPWRRAGSGSHVVVLGGDRVIKLFAPFWTEDARAERLALEELGGRAVPEIAAAGELEGWPYLVLSFIEGDPASVLWADLDPSSRLRILGELGEFIGRTRAHRVEGLETDWVRFLEARRAASPEHHRVPESWHPWIAERMTGLADPPFSPGLLHADLTDDHIFLVRRNGAWKLSGVIDFGDAMMGHPLYEFVAPACFLTLGQPPELRHLVEASGLVVTEDLEERLTTYCLFHQYGRLEMFLERCPIADGAAFRRALWG